MTTHHKHLFKFFGIIFGLYLLFVVLWTLIGGCYSTFFRSTGQAFFRNFGSSGYTEFLDNPTQDEDSKDILVYLYGKNSDGSVRQRPRAFLQLESRYYGYIPTILVLALTLATPLPWRRRWVLVAVSLGFVHIFIGIKLWVVLLDTFAMDGFKVIALGSVSRTLLAGVLKVLSYVENSFIISFLVWVVSCVVTLRPKDWKGLSRTFVPGKV